MKKKSLVIYGWFVFMIAMGLLLCRLMEIAKAGV